MKLVEIGEFGLIERFSKQFFNLIPEGVTGIGDDCAVLPWNEKESLVVTTDMLVEKIHFLQTDIEPGDLGYKSLAVNLSDVAAMGGRPQSAFLSLALPKNTEISWIDHFFQGFKCLAESAGVALLGGDTTKSAGDIIVNVAVLGVAETTKIKYRHSAKPGDIICTTGFTGESSAGLQMICDNFPENKLKKYLVKKHNCPRPHIAEGCFLAEFQSVHAMLDVSDGIDSDLRHILKHSNVSARIEIDKIPISNELRQAARDLIFNPIEKALAGGEDYCLLLTIEKSEFKKLSRTFEKKFGRALFDVGEIVSGNKELIYLKGGRIINLIEKGFDHFRQD